MSTPVTFAGVSYNIPAFNDTGYAQGPGNLSSYLIALATGTLQTGGGTFSLLAPLSFGPTFGISAASFSSVTALPATLGQIRLAKTDTIDWRNNANSANLALGINGSDQLTFNGVALPSTGGAGSFNSLTVGPGGPLTISGAGNFLGLFGVLLPVRFFTNSQSNFIDLRGPAVSTTYALTLPVAQGGAGTFLQNDGTGQLSFAAPSGSGTVNAGTANQLAFYPASSNAVSSTADATLNSLGRLTLGTTSGHAGGLTLNSPSGTLGTLSLDASDNAGNFAVSIRNLSQAGARVYSIPDAGASANFVLSEGAATINGVKTFGGGAGAITLSASTIAMGANKITGLANGTAAGDAINFGQIVAPTVQKFLSGSGTYTTPTSPRTPLYLRVRMVGGGGGGGGSGSGAATGGGNGGNSTFGTTLLVANGGTGGTWAGTGSPSPGGTASLGAAIGLAISGSFGSTINSFTGVNSSGGIGGNSALGGAGGSTAGAAGNAGATNSGSGGGGAGSGAVTALPGNGGGAGGFVDAILTSPLTTYAYAIGTAGTAGGAGTSGFAGAAGAAGIILVEEFYQ